MPEDLLRDRRRRPGRRAADRRPPRACPRSSGTPTRGAAARRGAAEILPARWSAACRSAPPRPAPMRRRGGARPLPRAPSACRRRPTATRSTPPHELCCADDEINRRLHEARLHQRPGAAGLRPGGRAPAAADRRGRRRVRGRTASARSCAEHFGGEERFRRIARAAHRLGPRRTCRAPVLEALSTTAEGVIALHRMMARQGSRRCRARRGDEPAAADEARAARDDARPALLAHARAGVRPRVTDGFRRLVGG